MAAVEPARQFPWITVLLVIGSLVCQSFVLVGNFKLAGVMTELGGSTRGWSKVGINVARSLHDDLDVVMNNVSLMLLEGVQSIAFVQDALDGCLSMAGNITDEAIKNSSELSLLQQEGAAGLALLQPGLALVEAGGDDDNGTRVLEGLTPLIISSVHQVMQAVMDKVSESLANLMAKLRPALERIAEWVVKFGDKIQAAIQVFVSSLDKVQKLFDQVMGQLHGKGTNEEVMIYQTFTLFDTTGDGWVEAKDLREVADLFSMSALQGEMPEKLVERYDKNGDKRLDQAEMSGLVNDKSVPDAMPVLLRTYARRLAEISGNLAAARQRDEIAHAVVQYLTLVCAKNMTKVGWVSDRLGNGSLSMEFTTHILVNLCLSEDDPDKLTTASVGRIIVGEMHRLHPRTTLEALDYLSNTSFWDGEGFDVKLQPHCVERVTGWVTDADRQE